MSSHQPSQDVELAAHNAPSSTSKDCQSFGHCTDKHVEYHSFAADGDVLHLRRRSSLGSITEQAPHGHSKCVRLCFTLSINGAR